MTETDILDILEITPRPFNRLEKIGLYQSLLRFLSKENAGINPEYVLMETVGNKSLCRDMYKTFSGKKLIAIWVTKEDKVIIHFKEKSKDTYYHANLDTAELKQIEIDNQS